MRVTWTDLASGRNGSHGGGSRSGQRTKSKIAINPETADFTLKDQDKRLQDQ